MPVTKVNVDIPTSSVEETFKEALQLLKYTDKKWDHDKVQYKQFTEGFTNKLIGCYLKADPDEVVLVRVNGEKTELYIDREKEINILHTMHISGLGPPLYCAFNNGICYGFMPGKTISYEEATNLEIARKIAFGMAKMHTISLPNEAPEEANLFPFFKKFMDSLPDPFSKEDHNKRFKEYIGSKSVLQDEVDYMIKIIKPHKLKVVFSHNDLLFRNIIYNREKKNIGFVDFEYGGYNFQPFDIGNHLCEFAGVEDYNPSLIPKKEFKRWWVRQYLEAWAEYNNLPTYSEGEIEEFAIIVDQFMLASHLLWSLWAIVQAEYSVIKVDYLGFAIARFNEYLRHKAELEEEALQK